MAVYGATAAVVLAVVVIGILSLARRSGAPASPPQTPSAPPATASGHTTAVTTCIATLWAAAGAYAGLVALSNQTTSSLWWAGFFVGLAAVWAAMERYRWGRWVLLGMSLVVIADALQAMASLAHAEGLAVFRAAGNPAFARDLLHASGRGPLFDLLVVMLAGATLLWLARRDVSREFEYRKRARTRRAQLYIAAVLTCVFWCSVSRSGMTRGVRGKVETEMFAMGTAAEQAAVGRALEASQSGTADDPGDVSTTELDEEE